MAVSPAVRGRHARASRVRHMMIRSNADLIMRRFSSLSRAHLLPSDVDPASGACAHGLVKIAEAADFVRPLTILLLLAAALLLKAQLFIPYGTNNQNIFTMLYTYLLEFVVAKRNSLRRPPPS